MQATSGSAKSAARVLVLESSPRPSTINIPANDQASSRLTRPEGIGRSGRSIQSARRSKMSFITIPAAYNRQIPAEIGATLDHGNSSLRAPRAQPTRLLETQVGRFETRASSA